MNKRNPKTGSTIQLKDSLEETIELFARDLSSIDNEVDRAIADDLVFILDQHEGAITGVDGVKIVIGEMVLVPDPDPSLDDLWVHSFEGIYEGLHFEYAEVTDGEGNTWDVEPERLTKIQEG